GGGGGGVWGVDSWGLGGGRENRMVRQGDGQPPRLRAHVRGRLCGSGVGSAHDRQTGAGIGRRGGCRMNEISLLQTALLLGLYVALAGSYGLVYAIARLHEGSILHRISFIVYGLHG